MAIRKELGDNPPNSVFTARTMDWQHAMIHRGQYYVASDRRDLANSSSLNYIVRTGAHGVHLNLSAYSAGALDLDIHTAATLGSPFVGTPLTISNHILPLTGIRIPECQIFKDVDIVTDGGDPTLERFIPIGSGGEILDQSAGRELVLGMNHDYLIHVDNLSNGTIRYSIEFHFYEVLL